ncbi:hypothetical protein KZ829_24560 [Actinoplanes hulinensis]|uniref:Secreted protein n=1 Tax=Actinoplanes hulinensis TaxID=1144547 RepID=A0ABS7B771_9ACTN|nr:hypothetical protein [Actinoplanes hulinensis]MBW6436919.1 hypothetical protein [Actinoplanes hulinensis]
MVNTVTPTPNAGSGRNRRWDAGVRAGVISAAAGVLALIVALFAWLMPRQPGGDDPDGEKAGRVATGKESDSHRTLPTSATTVSPRAKATTFLAGGAFHPESGATDLTEVPRTIRGKPGYTGHEIAIRCPSNETGDQTSDVTYLLLGRYAQFDVTVRPYFPAGTDQQAATYVSAMIGTKRSDGGLDTTIAATQKTATPTASAELSAPVDHAEKLTLRIECGNPNGVVVLTDARLTSA